MATPVNLPALGESVTEGTVTRWLKSVGDEVAVDEPLLEVSTDKVDTEIPSPVAGTLLEIKVEEDETVEVGAELAVIGDADESSSGSDVVRSESADESDEASRTRPTDRDEDDGAGRGRRRARRRRAEAEEQAAEESPRPVQPAARTRRRRARTTAARAVGAAAAVAATAPR